PAADRLTRASLDAFLAELHDAGERADLSTARLALVLSPERRVQLEQRLFAPLNDFADDEPEGGEQLAVVVAIPHRSWPPPNFIPRLLRGIGRGTVVSWP